MSSNESVTATNFIRNLISEDLKTGKHRQVVTRFPPEPNGYLHIGHAKSICLNFGLAEEFAGRCHLRFDDTNPVKEEDEYVQAIKADVRWLGMDWGEHLYYASDYFEQLYQFALQLIRKGRAYADDLAAEQIREYRGTLTEPGRESPFRDRSVDENLDLFTRMRAGDFPDGSRVLRAKIDMAAPNLNLRDPVMYRILHAPHHRTGSAWPIYPMYDFAHGQSDSIEKVTHSICTLEFEDHRPLYDWFVRELEIFPPQQIEFARLNLLYTVMSKRRLLQLVQEGHVQGWDDPRMPTLVGMRRRGYPAEAIRNFCEMIGVGKAESWIDFSVLEDCVRDELNRTAPRRLAVLDPLRVVITNLPQEEITLTAGNHPQLPELGTRELALHPEIFIEREDFQEDPQKKFFRLAPGREVRLRNACLIRCDEVVKDLAGDVVELRCSCDPETFGANPADGRKVKGTIHWVSARQGVPVPVRLYERLFLAPLPGKDSGDFLLDINPDSLLMVEAVVEPALVEAEAGATYQFERLGYFTVDTRESGAGQPVFNRTATLRNTWAKLQGDG